MVKLFYYLSVTYLFAIDLMKYGYFIVSSALALLITLTSLFINAITVNEVTKHITKSEGFVHTISESDDDEEII